MRKKLPPTFAIAYANHDRVSHDADTFSPATKLPPAFSLLELMTVLTLILLAATITQPIYQNIVLRAREATLRDTLFTMRSMINGFTLDYKRPPESLDEMVEKGYLGDVPIDPITRSKETWQVQTEDFPKSDQQSILGIVNVHSGSDQTSLERTPYSSW